MVKYLLTCSFILLLIVIVCFFACFHRGKSGKDLETVTRPPQTRAVWVTRWEYNSPETMRKIMDNAKSIGLDTVYLQVRGEATTFYKSSIDPWAIELHKGQLDMIGKDPGWDPLAVAIEAAHEKGLRVEAYVNIMPVWQRRTPPPASSNHVFVKHPEWLMVNKKGRRMDPAIDHFYACINPILPEVREYLTSVLKELVRKYPDLDGLHYDYIRYPSDAGDFSYDEASLKDFADHNHDMTPSRSITRWRRWRCINIERLLGEFRDAIRKTSPKTNISAATFAGYWTAVNAMGQRWFEWPDKDLVDDVVPMLYDNNMERFETRMKSFFSDQNRPKKGRIVVGIWPNKAWKNYDLDMLNAQLKMIDDYPSGGYAIFSYGAIFPKHEPNDFAQCIKEFNDARPLSDKDKKR